MFSPALDRALAMAALVHREQTRKGSAIPYLVHPAHVAMLLMQYGYGEPLTVAAVLHDVIEDIDLGDRRLRGDLAASFPGRWTWQAEGGSAEDLVRSTLHELFGPEVVRLVMAVSDRPGEGSARPWIERRREMLARLATAKPDELTLKAADALHNVSSVIEDVSLGRASLEGRFKATPLEALWYYREVSRLVSEHSGDPRIAADLAEAVSALDALIGRSE